MARKLPRKDVAIIGLGWTGSILANELTDEGLDVVALERGPWRDAPTDFPTTFDQDELRYRIRHELFLRPEQQTFTFRNKMSEQGAADPRLGRVHADDWRRRRWGPLERGDVPLSADRLRPQDASDAKVWREIPARRHDNPGLWRHLR
jgi:choline dehydrogenase-like flavoprotein